MNHQMHGKQHTFFGCGCTGLLPKRGKSNLFAVWRTSGSWGCRVTAILGSSLRDAKAGGFKPIDPNTPHSVIRKMMRKKLCVRCWEQLDWQLKSGMTPHLHHNHETGEPDGFTHSWCNPRELSRENDRLRELVAKLIR
jgi:hypothetical protein